MSNKTNYAKVWAGGATALLLIAGFVLVMARESRQVYTVAIAPSASAAIREPAAQQAIVVPADPMSVNVRWAPSTGEN
jgi:hypothetical protein